MDQIRSIAKAHRINPCKLSKIELIKSIQTNEGSFSCFGTVYNGVCNQINCLWRSCFATAQLHYGRVVMNFNLIKWNPSVELEVVANRLNRIFGRSRNRDESEREMLAMTVWTQAVDTSETDICYLVKAEIPGVDKEDVKVTIQGGLLCIQGERRQEKEEKGKKFHRIERFYGSFSRSFRMPDDTDENSVKTEFKNGMLNITLEKFEKSQNRSMFQFHKNPQGGFP